MWLDDNQLTSIPEPLFSLKTIVNVRLSGNKIKALPDKISQWDRLETFACDNNGLEVLPASIGQLASLKTLVLRGNALKRLPAEIGKLKNLEILQCSSNTLEELPDVFGGLSSLKQVFGGGNLIESVPHSLAMVPSSVEISLVNNKIATLDPDVASRWLDEEGKTERKYTFERKQMFARNKGAIGHEPIPAEENTPCLSIIILKNSVVVLGFGHVFQYTEWYCST